MAITVITSASTKKQNQNDQQYQHRLTSRSRTAEKAPPTFLRPLWPFL
jgi:hypothetical protein